MKVEPHLFKRMSAAHQEFFRTAVGLRFYTDFLTAHGKHIFIFGTTGSGKTNKGIWFVDILKYLELQIWFDSCKSNEILPLLCLGMKVRIIVPAGTTIEIQERKGGKWERIRNHPEVVPVTSPDAAIDAIHVGSWDKNWHRVRDTINIISFRNGFTRKEIAVSWIAEFFERMADRARRNTLPPMDPATIHIDESQWAVAGKRISGEGERNKASEVITENSLDFRSFRIRLALYAQSYKNIPPAARENMLFNVICRGGFVTSEENANLSAWCRNAEWRTPTSPMQFKPWHGRFVFENGDSFPPLSPWHFRQYPLEDRDRDWIARCRVVYDGRNDEQSDSQEIQTECMPDLGRFQAMAIKPELQEMAKSRWDVPAGTDE
mgnify:CR=1 FL=1